MSNLAEEAFQKHRDRHRKEREQDRQELVQSSHSTFSAVLPWIVLAVAIDVMQGRSYTKKLFKR